MVVFSWHLSFKFTYIAWVWEFSNEAYDWFILPELFATLEVLLLIWPDPLRRVEIYEKLIVRFVWQFLHHLFTISFNLVANFPLNVQMSHHMNHQQPTEKCQLYFKHGGKMGDLKQSFCYLLQWMSFILQVVIDMQSCRHELVLIFCAIADMECFPRLLITGKLHYSKLDSINAAALLPGILSQSQDWCLSQSQDYCQQSLPPVPR